MSTICPQLLEHGSTLAQGGAPIPNKLYYDTPRTCLRFRGVTENCELIQAIEDDVSNNRPGTAHSRIVACLLPQLYPEPKEHIMYTVPQKIPSIMSEISFF